MKKIIAVLISAVALCGCTTDDYTAVPGGPAHQQDAINDAKNCRESASETYLWDQGHAWSDLAVVVGGAAGGAVGGALVGSASSSHPSQPTLDQMIESCMKDRGYTGVSHAF